MTQKVFVVVGVWKGIVDDVTVCTHEKRAEAVRNGFDKKYEIERQPDGSYEHPTNDVILYEETLDEKED